MRPTGATELELAALWLALAILVWVSAALIVKRLHDRDKSALWYPLFGLAPAICYQLGEVFSSNISNQLSPAQIGFLAVLARAVGVGDRRAWFPERHQGTEPLRPRSAGVAKVERGRLGAHFRPARGGIERFCAGYALISPFRSLPFGLTRVGAR